MPEFEIDTYLTLEAPSEGVYKEKGSKFIAKAYPVRSEDEIKEIMAGLRKTYYDARHHCFAYYLGEKGQYYRANDDGEPSHSAGDPILGQIRSRNLTNVLVVVIRYFGGIKLGVSGLINAYKMAAADALDQVQFIEKTVQVPLKVLFGYEQMNTVMKLVKDYHLEIASQNFEATCKMELWVRKSLAEEVKAKLSTPDIVVC
jgi:uncharacterized YigZ family protein